MTRFWSVLFIAATAGLLAWAFLSGIDRGEDKTIPLSSVGHFTNTVCAILSVEKYATGRYVCTSGARRIMREAGLSFDAPDLGGRTVDQWRSDALALDRGLATATSAAAPLWDGDLYTIGWGLDAGLMDYVQLAFAVFGRSIEAFYRGFFALLGVSAALFLVQFHRRLFPLLVVTVTAYTVADFLRADLADFSLGSAGNPRLLSFLAIAPLLHVLFLVLYAERPNIKTVALLVPQGMILALAGGGRALTYWVLIAMLAIAMALWCLQGWRRALRRSWAVGIVLACVGTQMIMAAVVADWRIGPTGGMRFHTFWEPLYYNLQYHPQWKEKYGAAHNHTTGDETTLVAAKAYIERHPDLDLRVDTHVGYEYVTKLVYLEFVANDPWFVVELKGYNLVTAGIVLRDGTRGAWGRVPWWGFVLAGIAAMAAAEQAAIILRGVLSIMVFALLSALPIWATVVNIDLCGDMVVMATLASFVAVLMLVGYPTARVARFSVAVVSATSRRVASVGRGRATMRH